jgi:dihydrofolate reductase
MQVTLIAAQSLDGFITRHDRPGSGFTSPADKLHFSKALNDFDCQLMGAETYRVWRDRGSPPVPFQRPQWVLTRHPERFAKEGAPRKLEFTNQAPAAVLAAIEAQGFHHCALLGGSQIHHLFFEAGLVDQLWLTIEPVLFGEGTPLLSKRADVQLRLISQATLSPDTLLLKYRVNKTIVA